MHQTTTNRPHAGRGKNLAYFGPAHHLFFGRWSQKASQGSSHILDDLVDDAVVANFHAFLHGEVAGRRLGVYVETKQNGTRGRRQQYIRFRDGSHCAVNDVDSHFLVGYAAQLFSYGLDRSIDIAFDHYPQLLNVPLLDLIV